VTRLKLAFSPFLTIELERHIMMWMMPWLMRIMLWKKTKIMRWVML
jgi:hypothetical protein